MIKKVDEIDEVLAAVGRLVEREHVSVAEIARGVGLSAGSVSAHLAAGRRRDPSPRSLALYRLFLNQQQSESTADLGPLFRAAGSRADWQTTPVCGRGAPPRPRAPYLVVDLFSGCGGLSLGFDLHDSGRLFETVLAMDLEAPMIEVLNANRKAGARRGPGRRVDLEEFASDAEILAYYLDHYADTRGDGALRRRLDGLAGGGLARMKEEIAAIDAGFAKALRGLERDPGYRKVVEALPSVPFPQTTVEAFA